MTNQAKVHNRLMRLNKVTLITEAKKLRQRSDGTKADLATRISQHKSHSTTSKSTSSSSQTGVGRSSESNETHNTTSPTRANTVVKPVIKASKSKRTMAVPRRYIKLSRWDIDCHARSTPDIELDSQAQPFDVSNTGP